MESSPKPGIFTYLVEGDFWPSRASVRKVESGHARLRDTTQALPQPKGPTRRVPGRWRDRGCGEGGCGLWYLEWVGPSDWGVIIG